MLTGSIDYKGLKYDVEGMDNLSETRLRVISKGVTAFNNMVSNRAFETDNEIELDSYDGLNEHRLDIKVSRINVDSAIRKNSAGKNVKAPINEDFWCRLGALIRYAKQQCTVTNELGYTGLQLASNDIETCPSTEYEIKFPMDKTKAFARVTLYYGVITDLHIQTDDFKIDLTEDNSTTSLLTLVKNGYSLGIKFDEEYLGFPIPKQAPRPVTTGNLYQTIEEVVAAHPEKEFSWLLEKNYQIVTDENLEEVCKYIMDWDGYVFYDTETTGLNITFKSRIGQADQLVGVVLSVKYGESFFFPTQMKAIPNLCGGDHYYFMEHYMRPILEGKKLITHNGEFDWKVAYIYDINCNIVHDTMWLIALTLGASRLNWRLSLKENAHLLLHRDSLELSDLIKDGAWGEDSDIKFWDLPYNLVRLYACADTDNTQGLFKYAMETDLLGKYNANKVYQIEINFMFAVAYQEFYGHKIDITALDKVREDISKIQENTMGKMEEIAGKKFNPNSPAQLIDIMYHQLGIPEQISRKTGRPTTDKDTIKKLAEMTNIDDEPLYPFASYLSEYRQAEAVRKIIDNFPKFATSDGYVFSSVNQTGASTGRVSINDPNYQSYNDPIKKHVVPRPGYYMFDTDYSSIEYRVLANMVGNKRIMTAFADPDFDYHAYQAAHMYGVPYSAVTKKLRKAAKGINFGLPYGMGDESLGARVFGEPSAENTIKARELRKAYFNGQEDIRDWFEHHRDKGVNEGYTETYFGRRRYYNRQNFTVNAIRRQAGNQVIQGCIHGDTRIQTYDYGIVKIKDVAGVSCLVWNGEKWTHGDILYSGKKQKCIVKFKGGQEFICSPTHKFLVVDSHGKGHWVEAQNLKFGYKSSANNSHVRISELYEPSFNTYDSEFAYKYVTDNHESNNVLLEDIDNSFDLGVFLGRLASDGSYMLRKDGGSYITQFVAEHEYNILPELRTCMKNLNYKEAIKDRSKVGKKEMTTLSVYSTSLVSEINELDIKHQVHDNIFADTEVLRGFLSGFYDGDGGISGKTITLTFGTQYNFEPMILDLQKALLFFGIRSRYRKYEGDRYVLAIKTNDNQRFLDLIGFLNQDKQDKGRSLACIEEEKTFGRCIVVDSVEVTDEYIDMYDVCNTDDGYYVADGIITHNTAADLYKIGVGRLFKRICKEGWLGKVLFSGFIHDELLGEVSVDINPADFLRVIREEYEVKVVNEDGTPWCPLYMGFGYGRNWYEAKSVEWSIKLQWEWVKKYGKTGYPLWHQNPEEFCNSIPDIIRDFEVRDIRNQILDANSQGKEIKPTLNNEVLGCCKEDSKMYKQAIEEFFKDKPVDLIANRVAFEEYLDKTYHIQSIYLDEQGNPLKSFEPATTTQSALDMFCKLHKTDRSKVNLLDIPNVEVSSTNNTSQGIPDLFDMNEEDAETARLNLLFDTVKRQGVFTSVPEHKFYVNTAVLLGNTVCLNMLKTFSTKYESINDVPSNAYIICQYFVDSKDKKEKIVETLSAIPSDKIGFLTQQFTSAYYKLQCLDK